MRILDDRGKIFGRINIIDFCVIVFIIFFLSVILVAYNVLMKESFDKKLKIAHAVKAQYVKVLFKDLEPELAKVFSAGDTERDKYGVIRGRILRIDNIKPSDAVIVFDNKTLVATTHPFKKDVLADMYLLCTEKDRANYYNESPVKIGNPITFSTDLYSMQGLIVEKDKLK